MEKQELWDALVQKVDRSINAYKRALWRLAPSQVAGKAEEIAATNLCYNELVYNIDCYPQEHLEYLLRFENPLEVMRDQWLHEQDVDHTEQFAHALWSVRNQEAAEMDYPLDPEYAKPLDRGGPVMTQQL